MTLIAFLKKIERETEKDEALPLKFTKEEYKQKFAEISRYYDRVDKFRVHYAIMFKYFCQYFKFVDEVDTKKKKSHTDLIRLLSIFTFRRRIIGIDDILLYIFSRTPNVDVLCLGLMFVCLSKMEDENEFQCELGRFFIVNMHHYKKVMRTACDSTIFVQFFGASLPKACEILKIPAGKKFNVIQNQKHYKIMKWFMLHSEEVEFLKKWFYDTYGYFETPFNGNFYWPKVS
jgi:hypothetical protein